MFITCLLPVVLSSPALAEMKTFVKDYTYQASEDDSRNSSRTISLREVKRLLLEELGTYLESETEIKDFRLTKDQIITLTAGIVQTEIVEEKWDGRTYWLKSRITADSGDVIKSIDTLRKDRQKTKELEEVRRRSEELLKENAKLREELAASKGIERQEKVAAYNRAIDELAADESFEKGFAYYELGNYNYAIDAYSKAIDLSPKDATAYKGRGITYDRLGNHTQAMKDYDKAIDLNPKSATAFIIRGAAYGLLGNDSQAIKDYDKAIELNPKDATAYECRGLAYASLGNYSQAIKDYDKAIDLSPEDAMAYINRGVAYANLRNYGEAIKDYDKAIALNPKLAEGYAIRGAAYAILGNTGQAIADLKIAARLGSQIAQDFLRNKGISW